MKNQSVLSARGFGGVIFCGLVSFGLAAQAWAQSATFTAQAYPLVGNTHIAADFNGDGKPDLAGSGLQAASVMLNNGNGTFGPKTDYPVGDYTQDVAAGDFNGDGKMDLVITIQSPQQSLAFFPGTGTGNFRAPTFFPNASGFDSPQVLASDINNDAKLDVVIMHGIDCFTAPCRPSRIVTVMLGNGDGTFQPARDIDVNTFPHSMALGDFNRDGIKDLAVGGENTELSILLGTGNGNFVLQSVMLLVPGGDLFSACNDVDVADFNRDGIQDIIVPLGNGEGNAIVLGNADGSFRAGVRNQEDAVSAPNSIAVGDYNRDGFLDVARGMGDGTRGLMQIMHGNGDGTFRPLVRYLVPAALSSQGGGWIIAADFNGDSKPDISLQVRGNNVATDVAQHKRRSGPANCADGLSSRAESDLSHRRELSDRHGDFERGYAERDNSSVGQQQRVRIGRGQRDSRSRRDEGELLNHDEAGNLRDFGADHSDCEWHVTCRDAHDQFDIYRGRYCFDYPR